MSPLLECTVVRSWFHTLTAVTDGNSREKLDPARQGSGVHREMLSNRQQGHRGDCLLLAAPGSRRGVCGPWHLLWPFMSSCSTTSRGSWAAPAVTGLVHTVCAAQVPDLREGGIRALAASTWSPDPSLRETRPSQHRLPKHLKCSSVNEYSEQQ